MASRPVDDDAIAEAHAAVAKYGSVAEAAKVLGIPRTTLSSRIHSNPEGAPRMSDRERVAQRDIVTQLQGKLRDAHREALTEEKLREGVLGLTRTPLRPENWTVETTAHEHVPEAAVLVVSDIHMGEVVDLDAMGGRNRYDSSVAAARLQRLFQNAVKLLTKHWSGPPPGVLYVAILGDLVTGDIHEELSKTNDLFTMPAVSALAEHLVSGLDLLLRSFKCPIRVLSVPGNHGRTTKKPENKGFAIDSYDTLAVWMVERWYRARDEKRITFSAPPSGDALVSIHGWNVLFTHGDRIGSRGGSGFVGPAATAARGMQKLVMDYAGEQVIVDLIVMGHFHTPMELEQGFVNGSLIGPSEYSRSGRMRSHPASQWLISIHPDEVVARRWKVRVGDPSEGSIYRGRDHGRGRETARSRVSVAGQGGDRGPRQTQVRRPADDRPKGRSRR